MSKTVPCRIQPLVWWFTLVTTNPHESQRTGENRNGLIEKLSDIKLRYVRRWPSLQLADCMNDVSSGILPFRQTMSVQLGFLVFLLSMRFHLRGSAEA